MGDVPPCGSGGRGSPGLRVFANYKYSIMSIFNISGAVRPGSGHDLARRGLEAARGRRPRLPARKSKSTRSPRRGA
ncbi:hypothetical protein MTP99_010400 [Tenebrio molitor]|jgi:hypothetical protein|nr:hypothetical protein MTP99_010400 [Tenebrio molitor]